MAHPCRPRPFHSCSTAATASYLQLPLSSPFYWHRACIWTVLTCTDCTHQKCTIGLSDLAPLLSTPLHSVVVPDFSVQLNYSFLRKPTFEMSRSFIQTSCTNYRNKAPEKLSFQRKRNIIIWNDVMCEAELVRNPSLQYCSMFVCLSMSVNRNNTTDSASQGVQFHIFHHSN